MVWKYSSSFKYIAESGPNYLPANYVSSSINFKYCQSA